MDLEWSDSDGVSLIELKVNLHKLKEEFEARKPSKFAQITTTNSALEWKKAEWNHTLGYTGNSKCRQQCKVKEAQGQAVFHEEARAL